MTDVTTPVSAGTKIGEIINGFLNGFFRLTNGAGDEIGSKIGTRSYSTPATPVAISSASTPSGALTLPKGEVLLHASVRCYVWFGSGTPVATSGHIPLEVGEKFHLQVPTGQKVAVIRDTADGVLNIIPVA